MSATFLAAASRRQQDAASQAGPGPSLPAGFLPLPVVDGATLTYERFLREYALPRQPCLITNLGPSWRAREWNAEYLLAHEGVDQTHRVHMADGPPQEAKERQRCIRATASRLLAAEPSLLCVSRRTTVGKALEAVRRAGGRPVYLSAWDYVRENSALQADFDVPRYFERTAGSGSETHVDTNLTSAWLWVAAGEKEWVCAHGGDHELLTSGSGSRAFGYKDDDDDGGAPLPDLFARDLFEAWPHARSARLYRGVQRAGDVCYNPSRCVHAVRNLGGPAGVVTSLTHNFVDASNLADVAADATRSINEELLPMARRLRRARSLKPRSFLKSLAKSLRIEREALVAALVELPQLLSDERLEELHGRMAAVRPAFERAARGLREALQLDADGDTPTVHASSTEQPACT
ncbi:hypothetical protein EMIHUDRAFT_203917 [Emiliania huxleyi CCMP1516]|uniref:JmjC domain-containing protein n=2 Tax=Emiliania huxleyi TaxID=2903 RepID=A0A0D3K0L8_EMIH1|nr:hypothetical protein EMIHUDRAFT_203917 [Emiliania huxleyi CCMP1516]EOD29303.1 hypothetical protein EMIHUDRAFT_203917 [Emiliania huxleyi CCMP1516]|eukprot:XP_005781732.1 hypothetical protein EMIHUDRAFT_203917 [Emiliania huxleyi CCMP1516]